MGEQITVMESLIITATSMSIVFIILFLISSILGAFKHLFKEKEGSRNGSLARESEQKDTLIRESVSSENEALEIDEEEKVIVALAASIMASKGKKNPNLQVKSIVRIK